ADSQKCDTTPLEALPTFRIYSTVAELPEAWNQVGGHNIFLTSSYLKILELSAPANMTCQFIGVWKNNQLCGVAVSQFMRLSSVRSFGDRDNPLKTRIRTLVARQFASNVLLLGNNMLTGQNAFAF